MCIFCAAVPVAVSLGARERSKQMRADRLAEERGENSRKRALPAGPLTVVAVSGLLAGSVFYHTHFHGPI
jgi:hypothetical protein